MSTLNRRIFLQSAAAGVWILSAGRAAGAAASVGPSGRWCVYVSIQPDNSVVMSSPVMDMGQFMRTTAPMIVADEMDLEWSSIRFSQDVPVHLQRDAKGALAYTHADMDTGGSKAVERNWAYLRQAGATARQMLIEEAAHRWKIDADRLVTERGHVIDPQSRRQFSYGEIAEAAAARTVDPARVRAKQPSSYRIIGSERANIDALAIVTGQPLYGIDEDYPHALQAVVAHAPIGAAIASYDKTAALAVPGVKHIVELEAQLDDHWLNGRSPIVPAGIAVVAETLWSAMKGRKALNPQWRDDERYSTQDSRQQMADFSALVAGDSAAEVVRNDGDVAGAFAQADVVLDQTYEHPLLAHACLEPMNCTADVRKDGVTVVVGTQFPIRVAAIVERMTGVDALRVRIVTRRMGGGFGRRSETDYVRQAVLLSQKLGQAVKITWTREDDLENDFFGPAAVVRVRAALKDGKAIAWHHRQAATCGGTPDACFPTGLIEHCRVELCKYTSLIRSGAWRPPMHLSWSFPAESMIDELAHAAKVDPLEFRLQLMKPHRELPFTSWGASIIDSGRMARCYEAAAEMAQWHRKRPPGTGLGIAAHFTHGSYAAFVVEATVSNQKELRIDAAWGAIDCGLAINPNHIRSQMQGGFIDGLNAAVFNEAQVRAGRIVTNNFTSLRWMRMREAPPEIQVAIIGSERSPTGVGEPPTPPAPAALANAIHAACGLRLRRMPFATSIEI